MRTFKICGLWFLAVLLILGAFAMLAPPLEARTVYVRAAFTGNTADSLDNVNGTVLSAGDWAHVTVSNKIYFYVLDASSALTLSVPTVIPPATNPGTKRWRLQEIYLTQAGQASGVAATDASGNVIIPAGAEAGKIWYSTAADGTGYWGTVPAGTVPDSGTAYGAEMISDASHGWIISTAWTEDASGNMRGNNATPGTGLAKGWMIPSGTAPSTSPADAAQIWVQDYSGAGTARAHQRTESGVSSALALQTEVDAAINPKSPSQAIVMSAAASASNGMAVADSSHNNMAVSNFTPVWEGSIPDWTPASTVVLAQKTNGVNGWSLQVLTTGVLRLTINTTNYDSTVAPNIVDGYVGKLAAAVTREASGNAGSVLFYFDGRQLGSSVAITSGIPATVTDASPLYIMGTSAARTAGRLHFFALYNRALTAAEVQALPANGIVYADKWGSQTELLTNGSMEADSNWTSAGTPTTNERSSEQAHGGTYSRKVAVSAQYNGIQSDAMSLVSGKRYRLVAWVYGDAANKLQISIESGSEAHYPAGETGAGAVYPASWTAKTIEFTATNTSFVLYFLSGTGVTAGTWYIDDASVVEIGATVAYEPEGIQPAPGQWLDSGSNKLHAMQPAAGSSLTRRMKTFEIRWTNSWAGTHEAQYVGGVNQAVLPSDNIRIDSITMIVTGASGNVILGDGSSGNRFVTSTALAAYMDLTPANRNHDGTNRKLVIDPDTNLTGAITTTIKGTILD